MASIGFTSVNDQKLEVLMLDYGVGPRVVIRGTDWTLHLSVEEAAKLRDDLGSVVGELSLIHI